MHYMQYPKNLEHSEQIWSKMLPESFENPLPPLPSPHLSPKQITQELKEPAFGRCVVSMRLRATEETDGIRKPGDLITEA